MTSRFGDDLTPEQRQRLRTFRINFSWWIKRGFLPDEADRLVSRRIYTSKRDGVSADQRRLARALVNKRNSTISRLRSLGFTERDIYNFLREEFETSLEGIDELIEQVSRDPFTPLNTGLDFTEEIRSNSELIDIGRRASNIDYAASERLNYGYWTRLRPEVRRRTTRRPRRTRQRRPRRNR